MTQAAFPNGVNGAAVTELICRYANKRNSDKINPDELCNRSFLEGLEVYMAQEKRLAQQQISELSRSLMMLSR